jgi:hypothetical protein
MQPRSRKTGIKQEEACRKTCMLFGLFQQCGLIAAGESWDLTYLTVALFVIQTAESKSR